PAPAARAAAAAVAASTAIVGGDRSGGGGGGGGDGRRWPAARARSRSSTRRLVAPLPRTRGAAPRHPGEGAGCTRRRPRERQGGLTSATGHGDVLAAALGDAHGGEVLRGGRVDADGRLKVHLG